MNKKKQSNWYDYQSKLLKLVFLTIISLFSTTIVPAQSKWNSSEVKTKYATFKCEFSNIVSNRMLVSNKQFESSLEGRHQYDNDKNDFSFISLSSHDSLLSSFMETFTKERIKDLAKVNERIGLFIYVDEKGYILSVSFSLTLNTLITPEELEKLEKLILKRTKYRIVGKIVPEPIFYPSIISVPFSEVEYGEIKRARASEKYRVNYHL